MRLGAIFYPVPRGSQLVNEARRERILIRRRLGLSGRQWVKFRKAANRYAHIPRTDDLATARS